MKIHDNENNSESQEHLEENKVKFSKQCAIVLELLKQGKRLTVKSAMNQYGITSLPRRLLDLKEKNGVSNINFVWVLDDKGKRSHKEWFYSPKTEEETLHHFANSLIEIATKQSHVQNQINFPE
ncbi:MAG TPA: helix-turn-helix domain-containing protein [Ignavibacteriaceae bacterium]